MTVAPLAGFTIGVADADCCQPVSRVLEQLGARIVDAPSARAAHPMPVAGLDAAVLAGTTAASVTALQRSGIPVVHVQHEPAEEVVEQVAAALSARTTVATAAGHRLELRGTAVLVDDAFVPLAAGGMAVLRLLAGAQGRVLSRDVLLGRLPGDSHDGHAVEATIGRLRAALGDPAIIQTVVKRGYRLRVGAA